MNLLKQILRYSWIVIGIAIGVALAHVFLPSPVKYVDKFLPVRDDKVVNELSTRYEKVIADTTASLWEKIVGLKKRPNPTGTFGTPRPDPLPAEKVIVRDTVRKTDTVWVATRLDIPILFEATQEQYSITTRNPYNLYSNQPYIKTYTFPRVANDFSMALRETSAYDRLDGINLIQRRRWFEWEGFGLIVGTEYPMTMYMGADARVRFWEVIELSPRLTSKPSLGVELRYGF